MTNANVFDCKQGPFSDIHYIWACSRGQNCCGTTNSSCCNDTGVDLFSIPPASSLWRASPFPETSPESRSTTGYTPSQPTGVATLPTSVTSIETSNRHRGLFIFLGISICLELAMIAGLVFLGVQMRRNSRQQHRSEGFDEGKGRAEEREVSSDLREYTKGSQVFHEFMQPTELAATHPALELPNH